jgi:glycosyltransferase involved in cell wall biosynthesis
MTLVEAEQMGCIPVAFNSFNTLNEVITDNVNGRIVPNNDIEKYTLAILDLMQNPEKRYQMIRKGLARSKKYDQDSICAKWKIIIEALFME